MGSLFGPPRHIVILGVNVQRSTRGCITADHENDLSLHTCTPHSVEILCLPLPLLELPQLSSHRLAMLRLGEGLQWHRLFFVIQQQDLVGNMYRNQ